MCKIKNIPLLTMVVEFLSMKPYSSPSWCVVSQWCVIIKYQFQT